ncbi:MAG TPA: multiheme c-type cytochrome [Candidatus Eisenbacteria bacterium]
MIRPLRSPGKVPLPALLLSMAALGSGCAMPSPKDARAVIAARAFQSTLPAYLRPVGHSPVPKGLTGMRAADCGACHVEIYAEWKESSHARAFRDDPQFMEELRKTTATSGRDASWICLNCHTPFEAQLPRLLAGLEKGDRGLPIYVDNPSFDPRMQEEGVTCATCHVRDGVVLGPTGAGRAPHAVQRSDLLHSSDLCLQCHEVNARIDDVGLVCLFDTGVTYAAGPDAAEGKSCQECHMPEVERPLTNLGTPPRTTRRHWFGGSLIPKKPEFEAAMAPIRAHYKSGALVAWTDLPEAFPAGKRATVTFSVTNAEAGHSLPTGDVERHIVITARLRGSDGTLLAERAERFGTRYEWYPAARRLDDTRLGPRETRTFTLEFEAPSRGTVTLELEGVHVRMTAENVAYHGLEGRTVPSRTFLDSREERPVR